MANQEHLDRVKQGTDVWNSWRKQHSGALLDLRGANLFQASLSGADLREANLSRADLFRANLFQASLSRADLREANLSGTDLRGANLSNANLNNANLRGANLFQASLSGANINRADLNGADLSNANLFQANLNGADLSNANLSGASLYGTDFFGADLSRADLSRAVLVRTNLINTTLKDCNIYGISVWDILLNGAKQLNLTITPQDQPTITVDNLKIAQFIYLLLNNEEIRDVINTLTTKAVLILGRFTPERKAVLDNVREALREQNYVPILFDFDQPSTQTVRETVRTLAHLSHFVIADLTDPSSVPLELETIVPTLPIAVQPILAASQKREFSMFSSLSRRYHWVLPIYRYTDLDSLLATLNERVLAPAEQKAQELAQEITKK
jgi:uncharacterized protein YjbI with pentapeptide repeats